MTKSGSQVSLLDVYVVCVCVRTHVCMCMCVCVCVWAGGRDNGKGVVNVVLEINRRGLHPYVRTSHVRTCATNQYTSHTRSL